MKEELEAASERAELKTPLRMLWNSNGTITGAGGLHDSDFREALGISEEQMQQLKDRWNFEESPEILAAMEKIEASVEEDLGKLGKATEEMLENAENFDEATMLEAVANLESAVTDIMEKIMAFDIVPMSDAMNAILTPEQIQKLQEIELAAMGELPFISPRAFEALNLTDEQREEMENIKKELKPEFEKNLDDFVRNYHALKKILESEFAKEPKNSEGGLETREETRKRLMAENPEYKRMQEEIQTHNWAFSTQFRTRMFDVLTEEQWLRIQDLIDNPPEYIKVFLKNMKANIKKNASDTGWQPGAGSWQSGDAIPEAYRQERNTRGNFPRPAN